MSSFRADGPMLYFHKQHRHEMKDQKYYFNTELYKNAEQSQFFLPEEHFLMPVNKQYMRHDNAKFHITHVWAPDAMAWSKARLAFDHIHQRDFANPIVLTFEETLAVAVTSASSGKLYKDLGAPKKKRCYS